MTISVPTRGCQTYIANDNQIHGEGLQHAENWVFPDVIRDVHVQLPEGDCGGGARGVAAQGEVAVEVEDAGLGSVLGLLGDRLDVVDPRLQEAALECLGGGFWQTEPEPVRSRVSSRPVRLRTDGKRELLLSCNLAAYPFALWTGLMWVAERIHLNTRLVPDLLGG